MSECYLHIGVEKTGSTSIQNYLTLNDENLKKQGIWYSECLGRPNNRKISVYARDSDMPDDGFRHYNISDHVSHEMFKAELEHNLRNEIDRFKKYNGKVYLISNEHCHSRLETVDMIKRIKELLSIYFDRIHVLCFVRPQVEIITSLASTAARVGHFIGKDFFDITEADYRYNYNTSISNWTSVFKESVKVISFKQHKDIVQYFIELLKIQTKDLKELDKSNTALDVGTIAMLNGINKSKYAVRLPKNVIDDFAVNRKIDLPKPIAEQVQERFKKSNYDFIKKNDSLNISDIQVDLEHYNEIGNIHLLEFPDYLVNAVGTLAQKWSKLAQSYAAQKDLRKKETIKFEKKTIELNKKLQNYEDELSLHKIYLNDPSMHFRPYLLRRIVRFLFKHFNSTTKISKNDLLSKYVFDPVFYLNYYPKLKRDLNNDELLASEHWIKFGARQGLMGSKVFQASFYLIKNPDLLNYCGSDYYRAIRHWLEHGIEEGRDASPILNFSVLRQNNPELVRTCKNNSELISFWLKEEKNKLIK